MTSVRYWFILIQFLIVHIFNSVSCDVVWETDYNDPTYKNHPCKRTCVENEKKYCYYKFEAEWFYTMSKACFNCHNTTFDCFSKDCVVGDGVARTVMTINRMVPGPTIEVCFGDFITVDMVNMMSDQVVSIHWHGHHQGLRPFMDGVPYITQCPILPLTTFRYTLDATNCGTHWWHSHVGSQKGDGMFGAMIVKVDEKVDPMKDYYDYDEHRIVLTDWSDKMSIDKHLTYYLGPTFDKATSIIANGMGPVWDNSTATTTSPIYRFNVTQGYCYRIRLIHAGSRVCPMEIYTDKHNFSLISIDGENVQPVKADSIVMTNGERYDLVICADQEPGCYYMRITGQVSCSDVHQVCLLCYDCAANSTPNAEVGYDIHEPPTMQVNPYNEYDNAINTASINDLCAAEDPCITVEGDDPSLEDQVEFQHIVEFDFYPINHPQYHKSPYGYDEVTDENYRRTTPLMNNVTFKYPPSSLYSQWKQIDKSIFCSNMDLTLCNNGTFCECLYIIEFPTNCTAEIVFIDKGSYKGASISHPMHLHGYSFYVVSNEKVPGINADLFKELDKAGEVKRHLKDPCIPARKDVMPVPSPGYTVIRFWANNPGLWFIHCHVEPHLDIGMALLVKVGEYEEWVKPPVDFPICGDFMSITYKDDLHP